MGQQDAPSPFSLQSPVCFFYLVECVVLQLNTVKHVHTHFSCMFLSQLSALLALYTHQRIFFFSLGILSNKLWVCWVRKRCVLLASSLNPANASTPTPNTGSDKMPLLLLLIQHSTPSFLVPPPAGEDRIAGLAGRDCRMDHGCPLSPRSRHGRTATISLYLLLVTFFYLDCVAFVSLALPLLLCQNTWELLGTLKQKYFLCPSPQAFFTNKMPPTCFTESNGFSFLPLTTHRLSWAMTRKHHLCCSFPGSGYKEGGRAMHFGHRHPIPVHFRGLWRMMQKGKATLPRAMGNYLSGAGSMFPQAEK